MHFAKEFHKQLFDRIRKGVRKSDRGYVIFANLKSGPRIVRITLSIEMDSLRGGEFVTGPKSCTVDSH